MTNIVPTCRKLDIVQWCFSESCRYFCREKIKTTQHESVQSVASTPTGTASADYDGAANTRLFALVNGNWRENENGYSAVAGVKIGF
jgi:hypothetical protein